MTGVELIAAERERQVSELGWTAEYDDQEHHNGDLVRVAICHAAHDVVTIFERVTTSRATIYRSPWPMSWRDRTTEHSRIRRMVIAGALLAAEIDRIQREEDAEPAE